jgi:hypothetical protein
MDRWNSPVNYNYPGEFASMRIGGGDSGWRYRTVVASKADSAKDTLALILLIPNEIHKWHIFRISGLSGKGCMQSKKFHCSCLKIT